MPPYGLYKVLGQQNKLILTRTSKQVNTKSNFKDDERLKLMNCWIADKGN